MNAAIAAHGARPFEYLLLRRDAGALARGGFASSSSTRCGSTCRDSTTATSSARPAGGCAAAAVVPPDRRAGSGMGGRRSTAAPAAKSRCRRPAEYDLRTLDTCALRARRSARDAAQLRVADPTQAPRSAATTGPSRARARRRRRAGRERHAPRPARPEHLVSRAAGRRGGRPRRHRREPAGRAGHRCRQQSARRLGIHEQLWRFPGPRAARARARRPAATSRPRGRAHSSDDRRRIEVADAEPESLDVRRTIWGPVIGDDGEGHALALAWTAHRDRCDRHGACCSSNARGISTRPRPSSAAPACPGRT